MTFLLDKPIEERTWRNSIKSGSVGRLPVVTAMNVVAQHIFSIILSVPISQDGGINNCGPLDSQTRNKFTLSAV